MNDELRLTEEVIEKAKLIEKYLDGEISQEEKAMLDAWIGEAPENKELFDNLTTRESLAKLMKAYYEGHQRKEDAQRRANVMTFGAAPAVVRPISGLLKKLSVAAAAIVVIGTCAYLLLNHKTGQQIVKTEEKKVPVINNDVAPGTYKARLTLADGSTIVLDSAAKGKLAQQGNTQILNKDGGLAYAPNAAKPGEVVYNTLTTAKGEIYSLQLADGSKVWLNSASSIHYPVSFNGGERRVEITGEAYFEVAHLDHRQPFKVTANGMEVKVLGTHFNIMAYFDEPDTKTTLIEGSVKVSNSSSVVMLKPGQQALSATGNTTASIQVNKNADITEAIAWKEGIFQFNKTDLKTVMRTISRWYDVDISYGEQLPQKRLSGSVSRNLTASQVLSVLEFIGVHFKIEGKKIVVLP